MSVVRTDLPPDADADEAAAILAAVSAYLAGRDAADGPPEAGWSGRRWAFAGRTAAVGSRPLRPTSDAPTDPWTAAGRADRL